MVHYSFLVINLCMPYHDKIRHKTVTADAISNIAMLNRKISHRIVYAFYNDITEDYKVTLHASLCKHCQLVLQYPCDSQYTLCNPPGSQLQTCSAVLIEPRHDKTKKWVCAQRKLRSAWASAQSDQSSLSAWRKLGSLATHWVHSEDSDQTGRLRWAQVHFVGFVMSRLNCRCPFPFGV